MTFRRIGTFSSSSVTEAQERWRPEHRKHNPIRRPPNELAIICPGALSFSVFCHRSEENVLIVLKAIELFVPLFFQTPGI